MTLICFTNYYISRSQHSPRFCLLRQLGKMPLTPGIWQFQRWHTLCCLRRIRLWPFLLLLASSRNKFWLFPRVDVIIAVLSMAKVNVLQQIRIVFDCGKLGHLGRVCRARTKSPLDRGRSKFRRDTTPIRCQHTRSGSRSPVLSVSTVVVKPYTPRALMTCSFGSISEKIRVVADSGAALTVFPL